MAHVITSLCVCYGACVQVCPVENCIVNGQTTAHADEFPQFYINPDTCIDCGKCIPECPFAAIYADGEVPTDYPGGGGEYLNLPASVLPNGEVYVTGDHNGNPVQLKHTRRVEPLEEVDFTTDIQRNADFFKINAATQ